MRFMKNAGWLPVAALLLIPTTFAHGYAVGPAVGLDDLAKQSDVIFQGTAVSNTTISDATFGAIPGFIVQETQFRRAYFIKGKVSGAEI